MRKIVVVAIAVASVACKGGSTENQAPAGSAATPTGSAPAGSAAPASDAAPAAPEPPPEVPGASTVTDCVIHIDEAEQLMGVKVTSAGSIGGATCKYSGPGSWFNITMQEFTTDAAAKYKQFRDTDIAGPEDKDLEGIGTKAYRRGTGMSFGILANDKFVSVSVGIEPGKPRPTPEVVEAVLAAMAKRM